VFLRLSEQIGAPLDQQGTSEQVVLDDFAASRRRRWCDRDPVGAGRWSRAARDCLPHGPRCVAAEAVAAEITLHISRLAKQGHLDPARLFSAARSFTARGLTRLLATEVGRGLSSTDAGLLRVLTGGPRRITELAELEGSPSRPRACWSSGWRSRQTDDQRVVLVALTGAGASALDAFRA
jgi:hypothetical protein